MKLFLVPRFKKTSHLLVFLTAIWLFFFYLHERYIPYRYASRCNWPKFDPNQTNILLISDPQLIDNHTYPGRNSLLLRLSKHTTDIYIHQNYDAIMSHLKPQYLFFLGDYLDNGRSSSDTYYMNELSRFKNIFSHHHLDDDKFITNLPGNHDIGFGDGVKKHAVEMFDQNFGQRNSINTINGVDIISLDTISLSNSVDEQIYGEPRKLMDEIDQSQKVNPRILLSHIPLYRDGKIDCGPFRESDKFPVQKGYQYQTVLEYLTSFEILKKIRPDIVFSGDDHDYCDMMHVYKTQNTREVTIKSISMAMGIKYPAVQILTFHKRDNSLLYDTRICYLPIPYVNIVNYVLLAVTSFILILISNYKSKLRYSYNVLPMADLNKDPINASSISTSSSSSPSSSPSYFNKIKEFIYNQENNSFKKFNLLSYSISDQISNKNLSIKDKFSAFIKKLNLIFTIKQSLAFGVFIIFIYFLFCIDL